MKKILFTIISLTTLLLVWCWKLKIVEERENNYDRWNTNLDSVISKTLKYADIDYDEYFDYEKFIDLMNEYLETYNEIDTLLSKDLKWHIDWEWTDLNNKIGYLSDFFVSVFTTLDYTLTLSDLSDCFGTFEQNLDNWSGDLSKLMDEYFKCNEDDISRIMWFMDENDNFLEIEEKYNTSEYVDVFATIDMAYQAIWELKDELADEFDAIFNKFEAKYKDDPLWSEKKYTSDTLEEATSRLEKERALWRFKEME